MGETKYVLVDSSGSPLMRGDKVLLDKKCCEDDQVSMCVYYLRSECQGDGTFGHVFLHRTECVTMPEKDVPGWTDALKPGIWRSAGRNVIEVPLAESKACDKCVVETDEDNTDKIVCREFDADLLEQLFNMMKKDGERIEPSDITRIEGEIVELLNGMKHESEDNEGGEQVA